MSFEAHLGNIGRPCVKKNFFFSGFVPEYPTTFWSLLSVSSQATHTPGTLCQGGAHCPAPLIPGNGSSVPKTQCAATPHSSLQRPLCHHSVVLKVCLSPIPSRTLLGKITPSWDGSHAQRPYRGSWRGQIPEQNLIARLLGARSPPPPPVVCC